MRNPNSCIRPVSDFVTSSGDRVHIIFEARFTGQTMRLVEVGSEDVQDLIESYAPFTDLNYMLSRLKLGDMSVYSSRKPMYGNFADLPANPVDAINLIHGAEDAFGALSVEEKQTYNNDYRVWLASMLNRAISPSDGVPVVPGAGDPVDVLTPEE